MSGPGPRGLAGLSAIWIREIRGRMRGKRAFVFLTFYLAVLGGLLWLGLRAATGGPLGALESVSVGRGIFAAIVLIETLVVLILAPAYTAASISQEREKQTFDLLAVTPVSSLAIVVGKLMSALSFLGIVVGASIPLASLAFLFGGVGLEDLLLAYLVVVSVGIGAGALGVACSAIFRRTQSATVAAFVAVALAAGGGTVAWISLASRAQEDNAPPPSEALLYLNPFVAQADLLCAATGGACFATPGQPPVTNVVVTPVGPAPRFGQPAIAPAPQPEPQGTAPGTLWPKTIIAWLLVAGVAIVVAAETVSPTRRLSLPKQLRLALPSRRRGIDR
jgi:ABC-type transport system involved in multi-copper enzyme maturation permease subunit